MEIDLTYSAEEQSHMVDALFDDPVFPVEYGADHALEDFLHESLCSEFASDNVSMEPKLVAETNSVGLVEGDGRRRSGRLASRTNLKKPAKKTGEEEDVCFICFNGGNLVACDRRGCTKAYHPACVNLDDAFFKGKTPWNCGWHTCKDCERASHYICYTGMHSICKGCFKGDQFFCIRGNKGFCKKCMETVMMIEKGAKAKKGMAEVGFDDRNSFEYLFKQYWLDLKRKLTLTSEELAKASNLFNSSSSGEGTSNAQCDANNDLRSSSFGTDIVGPSSSKGKNVKGSESFTSKEGSTDAKASRFKGASGMTEMPWASEKLLEFVAFVKDGDTSVLSKSDVKALLQEYIEKNNLHHPRNKSQIVCDPRLQNLFGKERLGPVEMLKLLNSHFLTKNAHKICSDKTGRGRFDADRIAMGTEDGKDSLTKRGADKRKKPLKNIYEKGSQVKLDDFAAIDVHNISLVYLKRKLLEEMLADMNKFKDKVIGSFVRIRISGAAQNEDIFKLVRVLGIGKVEGAYKDGTKSEVFTLEIQSQDNMEAISIDTVSNQEFTEEECRHLRQSMKRGIMSPPKVGEILDKAKALQKIRTKDWLETEMRRLSNLRDRASEKGRRKELNECLKKLQLLSSPEERHRLLEETPEVHDDPYMDPSYASDEEEDADKKPSYPKKPRYVGLSRKGKEPMSSGVDDTVNAGESAKEPSSISGCSSWDNVNKESEGRGDQPVSGSVALTDAADTNESDKIWHYEDPSGKIQGPFSMKQLQKWRENGYFPSSLMVWKASEKQDSILLTDAINGMFQKEQFQGDNNQEGGWGVANSSAVKEHEKSNGGWGSSWSEANEANADVSKTDTWETKTSDWGGATSSALKETEKSNGVWGASSIKASECNADGSKTDSWQTMTSDLAAQAEKGVSKEEWGGYSSQAWDLAKSQSSGSTQMESSDKWASGQNTDSSWKMNKTGFESSNSGFDKRSTLEGWERSSAEAPVTSSAAWNANLGSSSDSFKNSPSENLKSELSTHLWGTSGTQASVPPNTGWGIEDAGKSADTHDTAPKNLNDWGRSQEKSCDMGSEAAPEAKSGVDWGAPIQGNKEAATQWNTKISDSWSTPSTSPMVKSAGFGEASFSTGKENQGDPVNLTDSSNMETSKWVGGLSTKTSDSQKTGWGMEDTTKNLDTLSCVTNKNSNDCWGPSGTTSSNDALVPAKQANRGTASDGDSSRSWEKSGVTGDEKSGLGGLHGSGNAGKESWNSSGREDSHVSTNPGWGTASEDTSNSGWGSGNSSSLGNAKENSSAGWAGSKESANATWGSASDGNPNAGQGSLSKNVGWGGSQRSDDASLQTSWKASSGDDSKQNTNAGWGASQGSAKAGWGAAAERNTNVGSKESANATWGSASDGNPNAGQFSLSKNVGWGGSQRSDDAGLQTSWKASSGDDSKQNTNAGWGASQGSAKAGWGAATERNTDVCWGRSSGNSTSWGDQKGSASAGHTGSQENQSWGTASEENKSAGWASSSSKSWGDSKGNKNEAWSGSHENQSWGTASEENKSAGWVSSSSKSWGDSKGNRNEGWSGSQEGTNAGWGSANSGGCKDQENGSGDWSSGDRRRGFQSGGSAEGKPSWNRANSNGDGGRSSRPPRGPRVCKFFESGHCKKGTSCNFLHA